MAGLLPLHFGSPARRLFGVFHPAQEPLRGALLVCPPLFHEQARSYRLFTLLADALGAHGIATLRFDYHGTGDSEGEDTDFTPEGACTDAELAWAQLQRRAPGAPLIAMGVRGGSHPAIRLARAHAPAALWLWQPVLDWPAHLQELRRLHLQQRALVPGAADEAVDATLMGFPCADGVLAELEALGQPSLPALRTLVLSEQPRDEHSDLPQVTLPPALSDWTAKPDMDTFPGRRVRELATRLSAFLPAH